VALREIEFQGFSIPISYTLLNLDRDRDILFLHGWGASKEMMISSFRNSFQEYRHIYIDLVGFGESGEPPYPLNSELYFKIIQKFLWDIGASPKIVFGHSFGGKIATLLNPPILVLLSSAGIPLQKSFPTKLKIATFKLLKLFGLGKFRNLFISEDGKGLSEAMYQTFKNVVDEDFREIFRNREKETYIFWGKEDRATPLIAGEEIASLIPNSQLFPLEGDHFFFINQGKTIENIVYSRIR